MSSHTKTTGRARQGHILPRALSPEDFLQWLRPGPWTLSAIIPDGAITTETCNSAEDVLDFVDEHGGAANIYYSVNPTKRDMNRKAKKEDIAAAEFIFADLDPRDDETPDEAKARYLMALANVPEPSAIIDSGNGLQALWRLREPSKDFADVEARSLALTLKLGGTRGTQNIDRVLRLPGTFNRPQARKRELGRVQCKSRLIKSNGSAYRLEDFGTEN